MTTKKEDCERYNSNKERNSSFIPSYIYKYEGIPLNVAINVVSYLILITLFIILRSKAWNYGKLAWKSRQRHPLSKMSGSESKPDDIDDIAFTSDCTPLNGDGTISFVEKAKKLIPLFMKMSDKQLYDRCGPDAVIYCQFQRYLMLVLVVMMFLSLTVIMPCNFSGKLLGNETVFGGSTIANLDPKDQILWAHVTVSICLMLFAFLVSTRFLKTIDVKSPTEFSSTIMITNIPTEWCDELSIQQHFHDAFPSVKVLNVELVQKVDYLIYIDAQKQDAEQALDFCYKEIDNGGNPVMVTPHGCGRHLACRSCKSEKCHPVDGVEYYQSEVVRLSNMFIAEKSAVVHGPKLPIVFVTFENVQQSLLVRRDYIYQNYLCLNKPPTCTSDLSKDMESSKWKVVFAPMAEDILWQNLHKRGWRWWIVFALINLVVVLVVIFLSTPAVVLKYITSNKIINQYKYAVVVQFLPSLIIVLVSSLMPVLVYWSVELSGHWTKSSRNKALMNKLYTVLITTVLILPSLGFTSVTEFAKWSFTYNNKTDVGRWDCIFMQDGGAIFCNYIVTASFIGTALELLRFGELFMFSCRLLFSKSRAEDRTIAKKVVWEFQFGLGYAWTLAIFTVISAYCVIVPLITPFGFAYLILKHLVDRYNLINVNSYSVVHKSVHINGAHLMQIAQILTQATVLIYITFRSFPKFSSMSICSLTAFVFGLVLVFGRMSRRWIKSLSFMKYALGRPVSVVEDNEVQTEPVVVAEDEDFILMDSSRVSQKPFIPMQMMSDERRGDTLPRPLRPHSRLSVDGAANAGASCNYGSQ